MKLPYISLNCRSLQYLYKRSKSINGLIDLLIHHFVPQILFFLSWLVRKTTWYKDSFETFGTLESPFLILAELAQLAGERTVNVVVFR